VLGNRVKDLALEGFAAAGIQVPAGSAGASMDLKDMPAPIRDITRAAYGDAIAEVFLISAIVGLVALVAILFIKEKPLRRTVDIRPEASASDSVTGSGTAAGVETAAGEAAHATAAGHDAGTTGIVDLDREFIEVLSRQRANESRFPDAVRLGLENLQNNDGEARGEREGARLRARTMVAEARTDDADTVPLLLQTQRLLAEQQVQLADALRAVHEQAAEQRAIATEQARVAEQLTTLRRRLAKERKLQRAAADYIATHGRHRGA
jgi:hypothetical protein